MNGKTERIGNGRGILVLQRLMTCSALAVMSAIALPLLPASCAEAPPEEGA
jgi:hypothetical protein